MDDNEICWQNEIARRARIYEDIEAGNRFEGLMNRVDYTAIAVLTVVLVSGFWIWGA